jgi:multidrug efflux pump subunit AcrA (membrane-fusion protein)
MASLAPLFANSIQQTQEAREKSAQAQQKANEELQKTLLSATDRIAQLEKQVLALQVQKEQSDKLHQAEISALKQLFQAQMAAQQAQTAAYFKELQQNFLSHVHQEHDEQPVFVTKISVPNRPNRFPGPAGIVNGRFLNERGQATFAATHVEKTYSEIPERTDFYPDDQKGGS